MAHYRRIAGIVAAVFCLSGTGACDHFTPGEPELDPDPVKSGPGLFTGRSGSWTIMRR